MAMPLRSPVLKILSLTSTAPWINDTDAVISTPLTSTGGYYFDTGRPYAYHPYQFTKPAPHVVDSSFVEDFLLRVKQWKYDGSGISSGSLPPLTFNPGSPLYPAPTYTFNWTTAGSETFSGITTIGDRSGYEPNLGKLPCSDPFHPDTSNMDLTMNATSVISFGGVTNDLGATFKLEILFSKTLFYNGLSYYPYNLKFEAAIIGTDDAGYEYGAGYNTHYTSHPHPTYPSGSPLVAEFKTKHPAFGSSANVVTDFNAYQNTWTSGFGVAGYSDPSISVAPLLISVIPDDSGHPYFTFNDPVTNNPQRDADTGRVLFAGPLPIYMT
jgi:hypothetical protein